MKWHNLEKQMPTSSKIMHSNPYESCLKIRRYVKKNTIFVLRIIELRDIMAKYRLCCIGFITRDKVVTPQETVCMPGGTAYYFARAISHLQPEGFQLVTAVGEDDLSVVEDIRKLGIDVVCRTAPQSVCFENIYHSVNQSDRTQRVTAVAAPFGLEELKVADAEHRKFWEEKYAEMQILGKIDVYYKSIVYVLGICETTRDNFDKIFNLKAGKINVDSLQGAYQTGTSEKVTRMAFSLWNRCNYDSREDFNNGNVSTSYNVSEIFCCTYAPFFYEGIKIRYPEYTRENSIQRDRFE